jgi:hypothetical protein
VAVCWNAEGRSAVQEVVLGREPTDGRVEEGLLSLELEHMK